MPTAEYLHQNDSATGFQFVFMESLFLCCYFFVQHFFGFQLEINEVRFACAGLGCLELQINEKNENAINWATNSMVC